jgi:hypothetical protein
VYYAIKILVSAVILVFVSEVSKRSVFVGALTASLPLVSLLAIGWLYHDTGDVTQVSALAWEIFWLVIPSLTFFVVFPWLLDHGKGFGLSMSAGVVATLAAYGVMIALKKYVTG